MALGSRLLVGGQAVPVAWPLGCFCSWAAMMMWEKRVAGEEESVKGRRKASPACILLLHGSSMRVSRMQGHASMLFPVHQISCTDQESTCHLAAYRMAVSSLQQSAFSFILDLRFIESSMSYARLKHRSRDFFGFFSVANGRVVCGLLPCQSNGPGRSRVIVVSVTIVIACCL
jgi:hypothetical protein